MFWKRTATVSGTDQRDELDTVIDTIVNFLRSFGEGAFDTDQVTADQIRAQCEEFVQQIVLGTPRPNEGPEEIRKRSLIEARRFIATQRAQELRYVQQSFGDLRQALYTLTHCLTHTVQQERAEDESVTHQLTRLSGAFEQKDNHAIRREAEATVKLLQEMITLREQRQKDLLAELSSKVQVLSLELAQAREKAALDPLTQLYNRASLDIHLDRVADLAFLLSSNPCLLIVDIDHFKLINDKIGHTAGDEVIRQVSDGIVRQFMRREDFVSRYGGEEFVIVIPDSSLQTACARAERLRQSIAELRIEHGSKTIQVTISTGITSLRRGDNGKTWLARADAALYEAKHAGRNCVRVAGPDIRTGLTIPPKSERS